MMIFNARWQLCCSRDNIYQDTPPKAVAFTQLLRSDKPPVEPAASKPA